jgi:hypothetical protein
VDEVAKNLQKCVLDHSLGIFENKWAKQDAYMNASKIIEFEKDPELRKHMMKEFRDLRVANFRFGMLLAKQDEKLFNGNQ